MEIQYAQTSGTYEKVYMAWPSTINANPTLLGKMKSDWSATGINLCISWLEVKNNDWTAIDNALDNITNNPGNNLDLYVRVQLWDIDTTWYTDGSLYQYRCNGTASGTPYINPYYPSKKFFNFVSTTAVNHMSDFYSSVLTHLRNNTQWWNKLKCVIPVTSPDDESEYPTHINTADQEHSGFSVTEQAAFISYLNDLYGNDVSKLNKKWIRDGIDNPFNSISTSEIKIYLYNWNTNLAGNLTFNYPKGKIDWIDFKTKKLKEFFDALAVTTHNTYGKKIGLQFSSIIARNIEVSGFYDPTPLLEKMDLLITDGTYWGLPDFNFDSDYSRSICRYWRQYGNPNIQFGTETNWPGINGMDPDSLSSYWIQQSEAFRTNGASVLFLSHWLTNYEDKSIPGFPLIVSNILDSTYLTRLNTWRDYLGVNSSTTTIDVNNKNTAVHLSCEQAMNKRTYQNGGGFAYTDYRFLNYNEGLGITGTIFSESMFGRNIRPYGSYSNTTNNVAYTHNQDLVTNYMIKCNPLYLLNYTTGFYFTATSYYMPDTVYKNLLRYDLKDVYYQICTYNTALNNGSFVWTPALKDERDNDRCPLPLIWRTRIDLQAMFPYSGSLKKCPLPNPNNSDPYWRTPDHDLLFWAKETGAQQYPGLGEGTPDKYPGLVVYKAAANPEYNFDPLLTKAWSDSSLSTQFSDGHHRNNLTVLPNNIVDWAKSVNLLNFNANWPYIGTLGTF